MKLSRKILATLSPIAIVGFTIPTIVSCSCTSKSFLIDYKQDINCNNKKDKKTYHSLKNIRSGVKSRIQIENQIGKEIILADLNAKLTSSQYYQNLYFEFVYYFAFESNNGFTLFGWTGPETTHLGQWSFVLNDKPYENVKIEYILHEGDSKIWISCNDISFPSETYSLCKAA